MEQENSNGEILKAKNIEPTSIDNSSFTGNNMNTNKKFNATTTGAAATKKRKSGGSDIGFENENGFKPNGRYTKRRRIEDGAPKPPLTGYVRFMTERREKLKPEHPLKTHIEMTKIIADEWSRLSEEDKAPYLRRAEAERAEYNTAMVEFYRQKRLAGQENKNPSSTANAKNCVNGNSRVMSNGGAKYSQMNGNGDSGTENKTDCRVQSYYPEGTIPIFTDDFLDHNKTLDMELRALRKSNIDYEQQNSVLEKHIENMKTGVEKIENENKDLAEKNRLMQKYLDKLKAKLAQAFATLPLPGEPNGATLDNIEKYLTDLQGMVNTNSHSINKAKDIIRKLDLHITL